MPTRYDAIAYYMHGISYEKANALRYMRLHRRMMCPSMQHHAWNMMQLALRNADHMMMKMHRVMYH
jgi:hypothetical protein